MYVSMNIYINKIPSQICRGQESGHSWLPRVRYNRSASGTQRERWSKTALVRAWVCNVSSLFTFQVSLSFSRCELEEIFEAEKNFSKTLSITCSFYICRIWSLEWLWLCQFSESCKELQWNKQFSFLTSFSSTYSLWSNTESYYKAKGIGLWDLTF